MSLNFKHSYAPQAIIISLTYLLYLLGTTIAHGRLCRCPQQQPPPELPPPKLAILRPGDSQRQPLSVSPFEALDVPAAYPSEVLLQRAEPGL